MNFPAELINDSIKGIKGKEVIHSPGSTLLVERRRSGAVDNFHLQKSIKGPKITPSIGKRARKKILKGGEKPLG